MGLQFKNIFQKIVNSLIGSSCNLCDNLSENIICNKCSDSFVFLNKTGKKFCTKCYDVVLNQANDLCNRCYVGGNDLFLNIEKNSIHLNIHDLGLNTLVGLINALGF
jgi:protein-arginine kinase activator protein McsA